MEYGRIFRRVAGLALASSLAFTAPKSFAQSQNPYSVPQRSEQAAKTGSLPPTSLYASASSSYSQFYFPTGKVEYNSFGASVGGRSFLSRNVSLLVGGRLDHTNTNNPSLSEDKRTRNSGSVGFEIQVDPDTSLGHKKATFVIGSFLTANTNCDDVHGQRTQGSAIYFTLSNGRLDAMILAATDNNGEKDAFDFAATFQYNIQISRAISLSFRGGYKQIKTAITTGGLYLPTASATGGLSAHFGPVELSADVFSGGKCREGKISYQMDDVIIFVTGKNYWVLRQMADTNLRQVSAGASFVL